MKKKLLFVTYGGGHAHMVYPVVHALREGALFKSGGLAIDVLGLTAAKPILNANGVECFGFIDYLDRQKDADAIGFGTELAKAHHSPTIGISLDDSVAYLGLNYKDMVERLGADAAQALFKEKGRQAFFPLTIMARIFDDIKPDFVVTTNAPRSEAAAIETANLRGIDNLIITDLFTGVGYYKMTAKNITFLNEFAKDMFAADGLVDEKASRFYFTGNPAFDKILALPKEKNSQWLNKHFPKTGNRPLVLHADMPGYWDTAKLRSHTRSEREVTEELENCYQAAMQNNATYLIRPHPSQNRQFYIDWLKGRDNAYLAAECNLHELLQNIDLLIARTTTVALEAVIMHKRVLQLDCDFHSDLPLEKMGVAWGVNGYEALSKTLRNALVDNDKFDSIREKIRRILPDKPAAQAIADILLEKLR